MSRRNFVHLHLHTDFSLLDGACRISGLVDLAARYEMPAVAITDHGNLFGAFQFYRAAVNRGVKPIIGCEVYVTRTSRFDRSPNSDRPNHLVLLAEDETGYRNLLKLASLAYQEGFYYKPRIDKELLAQNSRGLIALSSCLRGEVASALLEERYEQARQAAYDHQEIFGKGNFFLEMQDQGLEPEKKINPHIVKLSRETGIPLVATNDCHYLRPEDAHAHEVLLCIQTGKTLSDPNRMKFPTNQFFFRSYEEMQAVFREVPESLERTLDIAARCNVHLDKASHVFPHFEIPAGTTPETYFEKLTREGFELRKPALERRRAEGLLSQPPEAYEERLTREIEMIKEMRYVDYFLIVWDFVRFARDCSIPVGPGRGSAAGSLVSYALHVTDIDPLQYGLFFERFLNPERISFPDIDIDFCKRRRSEVINYVAEKYGRDNVSQIITFGTMGARAVLRDAGRVMDMSFPEVDRIAKLVPATLNITLKEALAQSPPLREACDKESRLKELFEVAERLEGFTRHASTHAAGVVISAQPLHEVVPLYKSSKDEITTQYPMEDLEKLGLLKMDFLGLTTLTVLEEACRLVEASGRGKVDLDSLPLDDPKTFKLMGSGLTAGIFQFESRGMTDILRRSKPGRLADLIALNALYRPGPIQGGMIDEFIRRKSGRKKVQYDLPVLKEVLEETYGVIVYQEQVMQIANRVAGFSLGEADVLRRAMGKKKHEEMVAMREKFLAGAGKRKVPEKKAEKLFDLMAQFAGYGFNKAHSAAYALIAYRTAYLKTHYPVAFMAALLNAEIGDRDGLVKYLNECRDMGISILPPDVNSSESSFTPDGDNIRFGLTAIKNVGDGAIQSVVAARGELGRFDSLFQFCAHVDLRLLNKRVLESLNKAGAFDSLGGGRARLAAALDQALEYAQRRQRIRESGQHGLFAAGSADAPEVFPPLPDAEEWSELERLTGEKEVLGFYVTGHPLEKFAERLQKLTQHNTGTLEELRHDSEISLGGIMTHLRVRRSKRGEMYATGMLEDQRGTIEVLFFPKTWQQVQGLVHSDAKLLVRGRVRQEENSRPRLIASEVRNLEKALENVGNAERERLVIHLDLARAEDSLFEEVERVVLRYPGDVPLEFELERSGDFQASLQARKPSGVRPDPELLDRLGELCGAASVRLEKESKPVSGTGCQEL